MAVATSGALPPHQRPVGESPADADKSADKRVWEYPSPQMFYNAMKRKGWKPEERDMSTVVAIHNQVNETAWRAVMEWERLHTE